MMNEENKEIVRPGPNEAEQDPQPMMPGMEEGPGPNAEELVSENERLRNELRIRSGIYELEKTLVRSGSRSPKLLAESAKDEMRFDEQGNLTNAGAVVDQLRRAYPEQFGSASIDGGTGRSIRAGITKEELSRMTPAEIRRLDWAEIRAALAE